MCDYSLHAVASRPAQVGETLITTTFPRTTTRGFASESEPIAVCMLPGTELAFAGNVKYQSQWQWPKVIESRVGKFSVLDPQLSQCRVVRCRHKPGRAFLSLSLIAAGANTSAVAGVRNTQPNLDKVHPLSLRQSSSTQLPSGNVSTGRPPFLFETTRQFGASPQGMARPVT